MERRAPLDCHVVFVAGGSTHRAMGRARDISTSDLYIYTKEPAARGADVVVEVIFPYQFETLALAGTVRAVRPGLGMDVAFHELGEKELKAVSDYIDNRLRRGSGTRSVVPPPPDATVVDTTTDTEKKSTG